MSTGSSQGASPPRLTSVSRQLTPLAATLVDELAAAWQAGERIAVEEVLAQHDATEAGSDVVIPLIYEELCLREEDGQVVNRAELMRRFPRWKSQLQMLLDCYEMLAFPTRSIDFPQVGEQFGEFQLIAELGRGAAGRVFLATQPALSDRQVVLKVTPRIGDEHLSLARLQHSGIVPVYLMQEFPEQGLRVLCMPYLGGRTLGQILDSLESRPSNARSGKDLAALLEETPLDTAPEAVAIRGPARQFLARASYTQAVCWIGACLADALHYAHERGLLHLDVKPSNVLLASDGQPMLLDFHLAREATDLAAKRIDWIGGTTGYMSPEQHALLDAIRTGRAEEYVVDRRADIFALGVLLHEMLLGYLPADGDLRLLPRISNRFGSPLDGKLASVLGRCLQRDPALRFPNAESLAMELRRCLVEPGSRSGMHQEHSVTTARWLYRMGICVVGVIILLIGWWYSSCVHQAELASWQARELALTNEYERAVDTLQTGLSAIAWMPGNGELEQKLRDQLASTALAETTRQLHVVVDRLRFLDGPRTLPDDQLHAIEAMCERVWDERAAVTEVTPRESTSALDEQIRTDFLDLAILWTDLRVRLSPANQSNAIRRQGVSILKEAGRLFGLSPALCREVQRHANAVGMNRVAEDYAKQSAKLHPKTAWGHYSLGRSLLQGDQLEQAADEFQQAVDLAPDNFWTNFYRGISTYRLGQYDDAVAAFGACVALEPHRAECFYDRGLAHAALGHADRAQRDFERANRLDSSLLPPPAAG
jgi:serine/threonine protein kinase/tetratricopeptide (TPR) repeat protein